MKTLDVGQARLDDCLAQSQSEPLVLTRAGVPIAAIVSLNGLDEEQIELGFSSEFWNLIESMSRAWFPTKLPVRGWVRTTSSGNAPGRCWSILAMLA